MNLIEYFKKWKESWNAQKQERIREESKEIYQLKEYGSQLWLTYRGALVCPTTLLAGDAIVSVNAMRKLYIERAKINEREI